MCGIAGVAGVAGTEAELRALIEGIGRTLVHRGPDEFGLLTDAAWGSGIACCRLAISDPAHGQQPMTSEDGTVAVVSNGEIYNHRELRRELEGRGHRFRSRCDTEVIVHLYEELGPDFVDRLRGMYGIAVLDRRRRQVVLARDRMGMKPLYWAATPGGVVFGSEIKALHASDLLAPRPDLAGISTYLAAGYVPSPRTCFEGVEKVRPGEVCVVREGAVVRRRYWHLEYEPPPAASDRELADELDALLADAVADHLDADVPVGLLVSGGWDSTLVALHAVRILGRVPPLFTIVQPETPEVDEGPYARVLARALGAELHEAEFRVADLPVVLPAAMRHLDSPILAAPALLQYRLAQTVGTMVKTVVGGEGSDEQFGGYQWFGGEYRYLLRRLLPRAPLRAIARHTTQLQWGRMLRMLAAPDDQAAVREQYRLLTPDEQRRLLPWDPPPAADLEPLRLDPETEASCRDALDRRLALEITRRLPDGLLTVNDRMSMAHAVEQRMPFLDHRVVDFARRLPSRLKRHHGQEKVVLSLLVDPDTPGAYGRAPVPAAIARRRKFPLQAAIGRLLTGPHRSWVRELLLDSPDREPFRRSALEPLLERWLGDVARDRHMRRPLALVYFQLWWNQHFIRG